MRNWSSGAPSMTWAFVASTPGRTRNPGAVSPARAHQGDRRGVLRDDLLRGQVGGGQLAFQPGPAERPADADGHGRQQEDDAPGSGTPRRRGGTLPGGAGGGGWGRG